MLHKALARDFYLDTDVVLLARKLLGKELRSSFDETFTAGLIIETEAYAGIHDRASHAYGGKRSSRNAPMFAQGGTAYVYLCYGIHHLFNVVTNSADVPHAILIRAMLPTRGLNTMMKRRGQMHLSTKGPGTVAQALGIHTGHSGTDLLTGPISLHDAGIYISDDDIIRSERIGVQYAGTDALLPYRFRIAPSRLATLDPQPGT